MSKLIHLPEGSLYWHVDTLANAACEVRHIRTTLARRSLAGGPASGTTLWGQGSDSKLQAWVEWDWVESARGSVRQADSLNVRSNVLLLDHAGKPLLSSRRKAVLETLTYLLPWQGAVLEELRTFSPPRRDQFAPQGLAA